MSAVIAGSPRTRAIRDLDTTDHIDADRDRDRGPSKIWVLLAAFADAGACIDPTGVLAARRFARVPEDRRRGRR